MPAQANKTAAREPPPYPIESVDNALRLLGMLRERSSITVSETAAGLGVAPSTAHRLLAMLRYHGFARQDPLTRAYLPGRALLEIGLAAVSGLDLRSAARPVLEALSGELSETVHLALLDGADILFVDSIESQATIRVSGRVGTVMPASCTAAGKAILAELPAADLRTRLGRGTLRRMTEHSLESREALERELSQARERGYATNLGESEPGLCAVAAAIREQGRPARASITVSVPGETLEPERIRELGESVRHATERVVEDVPAPAAGAADGALAGTGAIRR